MGELSITRAVLNTMREGFLDIGYRIDLLQENYGFSDMFAPNLPPRTVELGVFALDPPSYRNACFGVVKPSAYAPEAITSYRALGAPQIFALHPDREEVFCWKMSAQGEPELLDKIAFPHIRNAIDAHRDEWSPESILRAKSIRFTSGPVQLDFFDIGLVPTLEGIVYQKLDRLLNDVIASCESVYMEHHEEALDYRALFRLIFRLVAAKLLGDRQYPGNWLSPDVSEVISSVEGFYFQHSSPDVVLEDRKVQETAWKHLREAFSFRNLSVEALAYVYENTLTTPETRKELGTHATPSAIAEYIVQNLPLEEIPFEERYIFEPFCGHAPFLTAALARLRTLLPLDMHTEQRHEYFTRMLSGMDIDSFACEVARDSLILADYPNPNGWRIHNTDFFSSRDIDSYVAQANLAGANIVLCNPPYEDFRPQQRQTNPSIQSPNKAVEVLHRILQHSPKMLGVVLPRVFLNGKSYRQIKKQIDSVYNNVTLVELPAIFNFSNAEAVLLVAYGTRTAQPVYTSIVVERKDYERFIATGQPTLHIEVPSSLSRIDGSDSVFWYTHLQKIWDTLAGLPQLSEFTDIRRGIQYNVPFKANEDALISDTPRTGFTKGLWRVPDYFEPYTISSSIYLNIKQEHMLYVAYKLPWDKPKVIANAAYIHKERWPLAAILDKAGLVCTQNFHGIWPTGSLPIEVISALLNGPIANAFLSTHRTSRGNQKRVIQQIPVPQLKKSQIRQIVSLVDEYSSLREQWRTHQGDTRYYERTCRGLLRQIDDELLTAYNLPMTLEQELIEYFDGYERPGPFAQTQIKPSSMHRLYSSIIRIEQVRDEGSEQVVDAVVIGWNPHQLVQIPVSHFPENVRAQLGPDIHLLARVNITAVEAKDLLFEDVELVVEPELHDRFA